MGLYKKGRSILRRAGAALRKRYKAKPGGRKSTGGVRVAKMAKDIMYLKSVLNPEKKVFNMHKQLAPVGQVNLNNDGGYFEDVTPLPTQGITRSTRNGASIKLHSSVWQFQFAQQTNCISNVKVILELWQVDQEPQAGFTWRDNHWQPNPFLGSTIIYDANSLTDPDNFMKGKCIARRKFQMNADQLGTEKYVKNISIPLKYNNGQGRHIRFKADTQTLESGQIYLTIRTDRGNISTTPSAITGIPDAGGLTGLTFSYNVNNYYYDN